ncbi:hypothetical protein NEMIN01_1398 [Nematocida minor]|uniref:uncharacterized protein n=1 Tax=Nematocida minor TaxID=1912983 RepID=UPI00221F9A42|nr:uncharacterized protein NEMIN01_1398 [Nematocida minor]KAI5191190.1 hypothetical protein NEMIN01_1398 [Nematocida minor]
MPLRNFEKELGKRQLIQKYDLDILKKSTIGIDGAWFVRKYSPTVKNKNVLFDGFNKEILSYVRALVESMEQIECKIVWIWNGMSPKLEVRKGPEEKRKEAIQLGWKHHLEKNTEAEQKAWSMAFGYEEVKKAINALLSQHKVEIINAPYLAAGQGAYMAKKSYIRMFFGATDYFLFSGGEKLILDFDFGANSSKKKVAKIWCAFYSAICNDFAISPAHKAREIFLLLGCEYCPTVPEFSMVFDLNILIAKYKNAGGVLNTLRKQKELGAAEDKYLKLYQAAKCTVDFHPVLSENSELVHLSSAVPAPYDIGVIFGKRIPDNLYALFSKGCITLDYISGLAMGTVSTICVPSVFESIEDVVSDIYHNAVSIHISGLSQDEIVCVPESSIEAQRLEEGTANSTDETAQNVYSSNDHSNDESAHNGNLPSDEHGGSCTGSCGTETEECRSEHNSENVAISEIVGHILDKSSDVPVALQWLLVLFDKTDSYLLDKMFVFTPVRSEIRADEEIDWETFEYAESFKFAISTIQNKLKIDNIDEETEPVEINSINGWRMEKILTIIRKKKGHSFTSEERALISENLEFIKVLYSFFCKNIKSTRHRKELEMLMNIC